jgi:integrase
LLFLTKLNGQGSEAVDYVNRWADFEKFCAGREVASLPPAPATVAAYAAEAGRRLKARTIERP